MKLPLLTLGLVVTVLAIFGFGNQYRWKSYWAIREAAYQDAVADVRAYHQCFCGVPEKEVAIRSMVHLEGGDWPSDDYMKEAAHFIKADKRDCNLVVTIDNYAAGNKP